MSRSRGLEVPHRQPKRVPLHPRNGSESNIVRRLEVAAVNKAGDHSSTRTPLHVNEKSKVADLEVKLGKLQAELKQLRDQLVLSEAAKLNAKRYILVAKKQIIEHDNFPVSQDCEETTSGVLQEAAGKDDNGISSNNTDARQGVSREVVEIKALLLEKEKEVAILQEERVIFEARAKAEAARSAVAALEKEEELMERLRSAEKELKRSSEKEVLLVKQLKLVGESRAGVETEMRRLRLQMEQWRKAAEAASEVLAPNGLSQEWGTAMMTGDAAAEVGRRRAAGVRVLSEIWKKKGQRKEK